MLLRTLSARVAAALAVATAVAAAVGAVAGQGLKSVPLGFLAGQLMVAPLVVWHGMCVSTSSTLMLDAVSSGIAGLRDRHLCVSSTSTGGRELVDLVTAYNSLGDVLRRERLD